LGRKRSRRGSRREKKEEEREKVREKVDEKAREKAREKAGEKAREKVKKRKKVKMKSEGKKEDEPVAGRLVGISLLRHGEGDGVHHRRQQIYPDGGGVPCSSDELVEQGDLLVCGGVCRQELPEINFDGFDLGWIIGLPRRVLGRGFVLLRSVLGRAVPRAGRPSNHHQSSSVRSTGPLTSTS
jgi:hypothetical protein